MGNFLPGQYERDRFSKINHNYLGEQFSDYSTIFGKIEKLILKGDYTLGDEVNLFEQRFAQLENVRFAIGVGSGTDALFLSLKALGVSQGDEVITTPYTFFATIGAIVTAGAKPVFVDIGEDYNIDVNKIEAAITKKTKAILPVHWSGRLCHMKKIKEIASKYNLFVVEDAAHAIMAKYGDDYAGHYSDTACFSMHPLKNLNVWGDGGVIVTNNEDLKARLSLMRNHGLLNRDECAIFSYNSRLDTLQAIVANHLLEKIKHITDSRISNAHFFDAELSKIPQIKIPPRDPLQKEVFHIYVIQAKNRDGLKKFLIEKGIDAKIHYPIPMHLQPAAKEFGYKRGDFPVCEHVCDNVISLPVHEFITREQQNYVVKAVQEFYKL